MAPAVVALPKLAAHPGLWPQPADILLADRFTSRPFTADLLRVDLTRLHWQIIQSSGRHSKRTKGSFGKQRGNAATAAVVAPMDDGGER